MKKFRCMAAVAAVLIATFLANGAVIFEDDFTNETEFHRKWVGDTEGIPVTVGGGSASISNPTDGSGFYTHTFTGAKPSVFTLSYVLRSMSDPAGAGGMVFCMPGVGELGGYLLTRFNDYVVMFRIGQNGATTNIFQKESRNFNPSDNVLTISKTGSKFHIFVNDEFEGESTDATYDSGDIALYVDERASAVFGPVTMTDEFTEGGTWTSFSDDFNSGTFKRQWTGQALGGNVSENVVNGKLVISTGSGSVIWKYVENDLTDFSVVVDADYASGGTNLYGIVLIGAYSSGASIPMLHFGVNRGRNSAIFRESDGEITMGPPNPAINGSAIPEPDRIEVRKALNSNSYQFYANGTLIGERAVSTDFKVAGVGIFAYGDLEIAFDNFHAEKIEDPSSVRWSAPNRVTQRPRLARPNNPVFYDLKGRKSFSTANTNGRGGAVRAAAGVYVNEGRKDVLIRKRK